MKKPRQVCNVPGCPNLSVKRGRCEDHKSRAWEGSTNRHGFSSGWEWGRQRDKFLAENPDCAYCGEKATEVHHLVPGSRNPKDWRASCHNCHAKRTAKQSAMARKRNKEML